MSTFENPEHRKYWMAGLAAVLVIGIAGGVGVYVVRRKSNDDSKKKVQAKAVATAAAAGKAVDYDATASMWADEDAIYRKAMALGMQENKAQLI